MHVKRFDATDEPNDGNICDSKIQNASQIPLNLYTNKPKKIRIREIPMMPALTMKWNHRFICEVLNEKRQLIHLLQRELLDSSEPRA